MDILGKVQASVFTEQAFAIALNVIVYCIAIATIYPWDCDMCIVSKTVLRFVLLCKE